MKNSNTKRNYETDKLVFSPQLANYLLNCGYQIIRIKKNRDNFDASVFVFKGEAGLSDIIDEWIWKD